MSFGFRHQYPRLAELLDEETSHNAELNYFRRIPDSLQFALMPRLAEEVYGLVERDLAQLDPANWDDFRQKIFEKHKNKGPDPTRGYSALFSTLNEVKGYGVLKQEGCSDIRLVEETRRRSPDWRAVGPDGGDVLLEVKTILRSDDEVDFDSGNGEALEQGRQPAVRRVWPEMSDGFKNKIRSQIGNAKEQMDRYAAAHGIIGCRQIVLAVAELDFDLSSGSQAFCKARRFIEACGADQSVEVRTTFIGLQWPCEEPTELAPIE